MTAMLKLTTAAAAGSIKQGATLVRAVRRLRPSLHELHASVSVTCGY